MFVAPDSHREIRASRLLSVRSPNPKVCRTGADESGLPDQVDADPAAIEVGSGTGMGEIPVNAQEVATAGNASVSSRDSVLGPSRQAREPNRERNVRPLLTVH